MADTDKPKKKIDLKARLGRTTQMGIAPPGPPLPSSPGGAGPTPPPPSSEPGSGNAAPRPSVPTPPVGSVRPVPMGIAPPPGLSQGIPIPPFAQQPRQAPRSEPKPSAAQQTIKVEIGEEIHQERKQARNRAMFAAFAGAVVGLVIGFVGGGSSEKGDRAKNAAKGAALLEKDVKTANDKLKELDAKIVEASEKLAKKSFPEDLSVALAALTIPFESANLDNKGVGGLPPRVLKQVLNYTSGIENLNKSRETLKNLVGIAKDPINKAWKEETAPMANFSVIFRSEGGKSVVADLVPNKDPFSWKGDFPGKYKVIKTENGRPADKDANRWAKGELPGNDLTAIPVDPKSMANLTGEVFVGRLSKAIYDMKLELQGNQENPTNPTPGLLKSGDDLANELHKASLNQ